MKVTFQALSSPFKGKRGLFRALSSAQADIARLDRLSILLIDSWKEHGAECGIALQIDKRTKKLRWRATVKQFDHQRNLDFNDDEMLQVRGRLKEKALISLVWFEHRRIVLNCKLAIARVSLSEYKSYTEQADELEKLSPDSVKTPLVTPRSSR